MPRPADPRPARSTVHQKRGSSRDPDAPKVMNRGTGAADGMSAADAGRHLCDAAPVTSTDDEQDRVPDDPSAGPRPEDAWRALLTEAASKSDFLWVRPAGEKRAWPAWHVWHDGAVHVVSGGGEQVLPQLHGSVDLLLRSKDTWERLLTVPAVASPLNPDDDRWGAAAATLAASRLNATVPPAQLPDVWRGTATITRIDAVASPLEEPGSYSDSSHAAPPPPTPATTAGWRPWHARGRRRRWRR